METRKPEKPMATVILNGKACRAETGCTLGQLIREQGGLQMPCAGQGLCGKCRVLASGQLSPPDETERRKLTAEELAGGIRLACRARVLGTCKVRWEQARESRILLADQPEGEGKSPLFHRLGAAVDIGTTTLAAQLYGPEGLAAQAGCRNPQEIFGADVISRMEKSLAGEGAALAALAREGIDGLLVSLCAQAGCRAEEIETLVITGNTAMLYLLTGRNPEALTHAPFAAEWLAGEWTTGAALSLSCPQARVWLPPCMSAFVGADITTALLAVGMDKGEKTRLLVDIGTNGEVALWKNGALTVCSTAAGPAFEGAGLRMGMQGETGAISHVRLGSPGLEAEVIGGGTPCGICGSGVVDAVRCLLSCGALDETGYLEGETAPVAGEVVLCQEDIRKVQLAKSAIRAGIETMLRREGLAAEQLDELLIAGGFGSYLNLENAVAIGLLPPLPPSRMRVCGNAALTGAALTLLDGGCMDRARTVAASARTLQLATDPFFQERYIEGMLFEEEGRTSDDE